MVENWDYRDDLKDVNEGFKDPGRRGRRRPDEPWLKINFSLKIKIFENQMNSKFNVKFCQKNS